MKRFDFDPQKQRSMHGDAINARNTRHLPNLPLLRSSHSLLLHCAPLTAGTDTMYHASSSDSLRASSAPFLLGPVKLRACPESRQRPRGQRLDFDVPGSAEFEAATQPCEQRFASRSWRILTSSSIVNRRYTVNPAVITFPTETSHVADIVGTARTYGYKVAARSGGVCLASSRGEVYPFLTNLPFVALLHRLWARR